QSFEHVGGLVLVGSSGVGCIDPALAEGSGRAVTTVNANILAIRMRAVEIGDLPFPTDDMAHAIPALFVFVHHEISLSSENRLSRSFRMGRSPGLCVLSGNSLLCRLPIYFPWITSPSKASVWRWPMPVTSLQALRAVSHRKLWSLVFTPFAPTGVQCVAAYSHRPMARRRCLSVISCLRAIRRSGVLLSSITRCGFGLRPFCAAM